MNISANEVQLCGSLVTKPEISHWVQHECFYRAILQVPRRSGIGDEVPLIISHTVFPIGRLTPGQYLAVKGQVRTYSRIIGGARRLLVTVFVQELKQASALQGEGTNVVLLDGHLCKPVIYRTTPLGREIADVLLAVNRTWRRSDYVPCIAWGQAARFCAGLEVGGMIRTQGRFQSRPYVKRYPDGSEENKMAYEVSLVRVQRVNAP